MNMYGTVVRIGVDFWNDWRHYIVLEADELWVMSQNQFIDVVYELYVKVYESEHGHWWWR